MTVLTTEEQRKSPCGMVLKFTRLMEFTSIVMTFGIYMDVNLDALF